MAAHSSILAWKIPWTVEPGRLPSMGSQRVRHDWATSLSLCVKCSLGISNFLEESSSLSHSIVFLYFFALITEEGFLSLHLSLHSDGYIFPFLLCLLLLFFSQLFVRPSQTAILPFCICFSWGWAWFLPPVQCHEHSVEPWTTVSIGLQALCLSDLNPWIYSSLPLYNRKRSDLGHSWMI